MKLIHPEVTEQALSILRTTDHFNWAVITLLAFVVFAYIDALKKKDYRAIGAGLALYSVHWFYEISNALICHFSGHALWTVPSGTSFLILVGVGIELSLMFSVAGLMLSRLLLDDKNAKILGINNRILFAIANAALFSVIEIFLAKTNAFAWVYPWWGALTVFVSTYIPFFLAANYCYHWTGKKRIIFIGSFFSLDIIMMVLFAGILKWI